MPDRPTTGEVEQRSLAAEAEPIVIDGPRLHGILPYSTPSRDLGGWTEQIEPGALSGADLSALVCTVDHAGIPLGRFPTTLQADDGPDGFRWSVELPESRADVREAVERGDLRAGSWRMVVAPGGDEWRDDVRHVHRIAELRDVAVVVNPAYGDEARCEYRSAPDPIPRPDPVPPEPDPTPPQEEAPVPVGTPARGPIRVEDRTAHSASSVESRIIEALASVAQGETRDLTHATASPVEPDDLRTALIDKLREHAVLLAAGAALVTTDRKAVTFPILTGDLDPAPVFLDELEEIPLSDLDLDEFTIPVKAIKAMVRGSSEAFEDSDPDLLQLVADNLNIAMSLKADRALVAGSIATEPKGFDGLLNIAGTQSINVAGPLSWDHILKAQGLLAESLIPGPYSALVGPRVATALALTKEEAGSNAYLGAPAGAPPMFDTRWMPITAGAGPKTTVVVFAPSQVTVVLRKSVTVEVDRSLGFRTDSVYVRGKHRLGMSVAHPTAIVRLADVDAPAIA